MKKILVSLSIATCSLGACAATVKSDDQAVDLAAKAVQKYQLTTLALECLYFDTEDEKTKYLVRVREKHNEKCGGDPETSPTLFFIRVNKKDGKLSTTARNTDDEFESLPFKQPLKR
ncbi:MAG TPA: hypothetical protein VFX23_05640 [Limnobacter sp.]|uniref:hypothetical protein n=1 Tax=Limnobacter sp. TaxID=2003368 RepID=UPI002E373D73|nr:hypothetical protein [Limnobacter sp.]HEX5485459.1 hypothetical protein [Limnobacter sp.]